MDTQHWNRVADLMSERLRLITSVTENRARIDELEVMRADLDKRIGELQKDVSREQDRIKEIVDELDGNTGQ